MEAKSAPDEFRYVTNLSYGSLSTMPGCPQIAISHNAGTKKEIRGTGRGQEAQSERMDIAKKLGYDYIIATVAGGNLAQRAIMSKNGWREFDTFTSSHTGNVIIIYGKMV